MEHRTASPDPFLAVAIVTAIENFERSDRLRTIYRRRLEALIDVAQLEAGDLASARATVAKERLAAAAAGREHQVRRHD
jgi:hypothetical protein